MPALVPGTGSVNRTRHTGPLKERRNEALGRKGRKRRNSETMTKPNIPGPDPDTRTPRFKLPPRACDAHARIFGPGDK